MTAAPVYDLKDPVERMRLLLDQPTQGALATALWVIRRRFGAVEADRLIDELREIRAAKAAEGGVHA